VLGEWIGTTATTRYKLNGYRLEEVILPGSISCNAVAPGSGGKLTEQTLTFDKVWRIIITAETSFPATASPWLLLFDGQVVGAAHARRAGPIVQGGVTPLVAFIYDPTLIREGATIGVSYASPDMQETLPEKLHLVRVP
jgi:hypothetical protein